jgi:hypothetical protein
MNLMLVSEIIQGEFFVLLSGLAFLLWWKSGAYNPPLPPYVWTPSASFAWNLALLFPSPLMFLAGESEVEELNPQAS